MSLLLAETATNPALGVTIFTLGGLAGAIFYLAFKKVGGWAWESYWMIYAIAGLLVLPMMLALATSPNACTALRSTPPKELLYCYLCGAMWGVGGITWGLMIRYLGVGLGLAIGCGLCSAAGTLVPPILKGTIADLYNTPAAQMSLVGVAVSLLGIILVGMAGMSKEGELPEEQKKKAVAEYDFKKGILVAIFSGLMSSAMSFGLQGGVIAEMKAHHGSETRVESGDAKTPPASLAGKAGLQYDKDKKVWFVPKAAADEKLTSSTWQGIPVLVVVLLGGFTVNCLLCLFLNFKNGTFGDYVKPEGPLLLANLVFAALAGVIWCCQFIAFKTGGAAMGPLGYIGWAVLMAAAILFSSLLGLALGEWKGTSGRTRGLLLLGLLLLFASAGIAGYSGSLKKDKEEPAAQAAVIQK
ncbi:MAG: L-rhamnose/proton symporter RhaT [Planctomycetota bacterium]